MFAIVYLNFVLISTLSFFTSWALIESILFLGRIKSHRMKVLFLLMPFIKLFYDFFSWNIQNWSVIYGIFPHMGEENSRVLNIFARGPFPKMGLNFEFTNGMGFTVADIFYGISSRGWVFFFLVFFTLFYSFRLIRKLSYIISEVLFIKRVVRTSKILEVSINNSTLEGEITKGKIQLLYGEEFFGSPFTVGILNKKIIFPGDVLQRYSEREVEAIIAHELAHITYKDFLINIVMMISSLIFAHIPIRKLVKRISLYQEKACDERAIMQGINKIVFSEALLKSFRGVQGVVPAFSVNTDAIERIRSIASFKKSKKSIGVYIGYVLCLYILTGVFLGKFWIV